MSRHTSELTDAQWAHSARLLPKQQASPNGGPNPLFRRLVVRWEYHIEMYQAFVNLACLLIVLRQL